jgi:hypothetical protein
MSAVDRLDQPAEVATKVLRRAQVSKVSFSFRDKFDFILILLEP